MKCHTASCTFDPAWRVHWPGKTFDACDLCAAAAIKIAEAMGFPLTVDMLVPQQAVAVLVVHPPPEGKPS